MAEKLTLNKVKDKLSVINNDIEIISNEYKNQKTKLLCKCKKCGYEFKKDWVHLQRGNSCFLCFKENDSRRLNLKEIKERVRDLKTNVDIIGGKYKNNNSKLKCKCIVCKHEWSATWVNISKGRACPNCRGKAKLEMDELKEKLKVISPTINILSEHYENNKSLLLCECKVCHHKWSASWHNLARGKGCRRCFIEFYRGPNHPFYNPLLTDEERTKSRYQLDGNNHINWAKEIYKRDLYKCTICGSRKEINAHHLNSYHSFPEERYDINNGVTLCVEHHKDFHKKFGYRNNTKEQFEEYLKSVQ